MTIFSREVGRNYLLTLKNRHSKSSDLDEDFKLQSYLTSEQLNLEEKQLLFQFRTQTYNCKSNFRKRYEPDLSCFVCQADDTQKHLLNCNVADEVDTENIEYEDIFKSVENQVRVAKILKKIHSKRTLLLRNLPLLEARCTPRVPRIHLPFLYMIMEIYIYILYMQLCLTRIS